MSIAADADIYPSLFVDTSDGFLGAGSGSGLDSAGSYGTHSLLSTSPGSGSGADDLEMGRADLNFAYLPHVSPHTLPLQFGG
ncbi:hypothetical protein FIBSPDRAFT_876550 [Athelia psychrophila]|uniref:Uncharacterized protein n=1 Tax=Athelia psychrophila TaxID=1759441 RepID=A0A167WSE3_9AGAM|nr:hypothetical protein FIBSPDRAFT_876550 [Fibularhizoctonia sp. CBS 109695]